MLKEDRKGMGHPNCEVISDLSLLIKTTNSYLRTRHHCENPRDKTVHAGRIMAELHGASTASPYPGWHRTKRSPLSL